MVKILKIKSAKHPNSRAGCCKIATEGLIASREIISQMELGRYSIRVSVLLTLKEISKASYDDFFVGCNC